jgi:hypothetical protein
MGSDCCFAQDQYNGILEKVYQLGLCEPVHRALELHRILGAITYALP